MPMTILNSLSLTAGLAHTALFLLSLLYKTLGGLDMLFVSFGKQLDIFHCFQNLFWKRVRLEQSELKKWKEKMS